MTREQSAFYTVVLVFEFCEGIRDYDFMNCGSHRGCVKMKIIKGHLPSGRCGSARVGMPHMQD